MPINNFLLPGAKVTTGYEVANSCRFNDGDGAYLKRTSGSPTSDKIGTYSTWFKIGVMGTDRRLTMSFVDGNNYGYLKIHSDDTLQFYVVGGGSVVASMITNQVFRDPSAWYNVILAVDTTQGTEANRIKIYVNGTQVTSFSTATYFSQNTVNAMFSQSGTNYHTVGAAENGTVSWDGYMAETFFIDGTQLAASAFGEFSEDSPNIWMPKDCSGDFTFGNNGFYLDFEDSGDLGDDESGNTDDFTEVNLAATDQSTDTPTNNFATLNPLDNYYPAMTLSEGNTKALTVASKFTYTPTTIGMTSGKWYAEVKCTAQSGSQDAMVIGITSTQSSATSDELGHHPHDWGYYANGDGTDGQYRNNDGVTSYGDVFTTGAIIGIYLDLDNNKLYFAKNGTVQNSGTGISITDPASTPIGAYFFAVSNWSSTTTGTFEANFGGTQSFTVSSGNADANGYGNFEYDPSSGTFDSASKDFLALCTKNLGSDGG